MKNKVAVEILLNLEVVTSSSLIHGVLTAVERGDKVNKTPFDKQHVQDLEKLGALKPVNLQSLGLDKLSSELKKESVDFYLTHEKSTGTYHAFFKSDDFETIEKSFSMLANSPQKLMTLQDKIAEAKIISAERNKQRNNPYSGQSNNSKNSLRNEDIDL